MNWGSCKCVLKMDGFRRRSSKDHLIFYYKNIPRFTCFGLIPTLLRFIISLSNSIFSPLLFPGLVMKIMMSFPRWLYWSATTSNIELASWAMVALVKVSSLNQLWLEWPLAAASYFWSLLAFWSSTDESRLNPLE